MDKNKVKRLIIVLTVVSVFLLALGFSYAFFSINTIGEGSDIRIVTTNYGYIRFEDGEEIKLLNAYPGETIEKHFSVISSEESTERDIEYSISLNTIINTITPFAEGAFKYELIGTTEEDGGTPLNIEETVVPVISKRLGIAKINGGKTHNYVLKIYLIETGENQNNIQGKIYEGAIQISEPGSDLIEENNAFIVKYAGVNEIKKEDLKKEIIKEFIIYGKEDNVDYLISLNEKKNSSIESYTIDLQGHSTDGSKTIDEIENKLLEDYDYISINKINLGEVHSYVLKITLNGEVDLDTIDYESIIKVSEKKYLSEAELGSFVKYTGSNGCVDNCDGKNKLESSSINGYCDSRYPFKLKGGWRIAYKTGTRISLISAGAPDCWRVLPYDGGTPYSQSDSIKAMNNYAIKYCNEKLIYGGTCTASVAKAMQQGDVHNITLQWWGTGRLILQEGTTTQYKYPTGCHGAKEVDCGYGSDIFDIGSGFLLATRYGTNSGIAGYTVISKVFDTNMSPNTMFYGVRPMIGLKENILITGGDGTQSNPYTIAVE